MQYAEISLSFTAESVCLCGICIDKINNLINNGSVKLGNVPRWWESPADI